jgi:SAM-dependent methyltransferase
VTSEKYGRFAAVYDEMGADRHSREMCKYLTRIIDRFDIRVESVLDLCCGTGTALKIFADFGWEIAGLDGSPGMLAVARRKLAPANARLYRQNLPVFLIPQRDHSKQPREFDLVTSFYDSLNYVLTETALKRAFRSVRTHLIDRGWFVFDMNTPHALKTIWDGNTYSGTRDDIAWVWKNFWYPKKNKALCEATFFVKKGRLYERFTENHWERGYPNATVRRLLNASGFTVKGLYRCHTFERPDRTTNRICVVARKAK